MLLLPFVVAHPHNFRFFIVVMVDSFVMKYISSEKRTAINIERRHLQYHLIAHKYSFSFLWLLLFRPVNVRDISRMFTESNSSEHKTDYFSIEVRYIQ